MFINFWYVIEASTKLLDQPLHRQMLGQDFVIFRDSAGVAHCLSNTCVHRGGSLAHGKLKGDCIECPYHGWQFNGDGECTHIPSLPPGQKPPARAKVDAYPTVEKYGLVFAFLGDLPADERPPIIDIPEWDQPEWRAVCDVFEWDFNYQRSIENGIDTAHNEFTHTSHIGANPGENFVPVFEQCNTQWGVELNFVAPGKAATTDGILAASGGKPDDGPTNMRIAQHGVSSLLAYIQPAPNMKLHAYLLETPVNEKQTRLFLLTLRNFMLEPEHDATAHKTNAIIAKEDRDVLLRMRPVMTPVSNHREVLVPTDAPIARYRELLKDWEARGWRIDTDAVHQTADIEAYAIPSPDRRLTKGWALHPVPLRPG
jgi:phenylpropionate dioxygenase-like ring-hydroxylating dioxygenase large terminal subunit